MSRDIRNRSVTRPANEQARATAERGAPAVIWSPFAKPAFRGLSSPAINVSWGLFNLAVAYVLLVVVGGFELRRALSVAVWAAGFALTSVALARKLSTLQGGSP